MSPRLKKGLGQHFLHDRDVIARIVHAVDPRPGQQLVEIGPGDGAMTMPLLDAAGHLTAIELDRDLHQPLIRRAAAHGTLELIGRDVLGVDLAALAARDAGGPAGAGCLRLVGNLPYYLSSPILFHCLQALDRIEDMHFMLQREVVERAAAAPGSKTYGRLSVMLQLQCSVDLLFTVPAEAFTPPPKVESAVMRLCPLAQRPRVDERLQAVVRAAFGQRRKTLGNALRPLLDAAAIRAAGIDASARAETLPPAAFVALAAALPP
ncbi:MAG TPA: 16S rRNA (adenine(1518)-N(6)/adenine(1519)-N(6))-dimethyltransferase RsmA [Rhodanobacteraceae bacterium]|nr:16S rRNA (adenine(1518)-N(6)/adenine(1519)-N(6))-dimethyltransferase RsmA [Rhodanobacteraceae bacterium]